ncbi:DUF4394 domain-containing protein [Xanthobacter versatilis]|uniref:DUF4394 domain-containing protein n=1 Tax=Xanthobacter autotrophicus (strain ATCC BAA-1158 / Py2) TaxID=78245 RepID=UPI003727C52F
MKSTLMMVALAGAMTVPAAASAQSVVALMDGNRIAVVDAKALKAAAPMKVSGVSGKLLGIDVRPADGKLYGLFEDGTVATIDPVSGTATVKAKLETMLPSGTAATVDFNPVADRLRVIGTDGTNLRANVDDGKVVRDGMLKFADADKHTGKPAAIVAGAYTNSMKGAKETALYDIDGKLRLLVKQAPPNDGILNTVGMIGVEGKGYAFDIVAADAGANEGWLIAGTMLYRVDLATGKATSAGKVAGLDGTVTDIAIIPAM